MISINMQMKHQETRQMNVLLKLAFSCHLLAALLLSIFGLVYLLRQEFMPHHAEAVARNWSAVEPSFQVLIRALMRVIGGAFLANALAILILLFIPFRKGHLWAYWAVAAIGLMTSIPSLMATLYVGQHTKASPPWMAALAGILLLLLGLMLSLRSRVSK